MAADEKWYFTKEQLANTPSRKCGYEVDKELSYRQQAANFIQDMGQRLQVTQLCINTAIVYMHRFYVFHSFTHFHRNAMAAAALFLAAKVEEQPRKLEHVIKVAHMCLNRDQPPLDTKSEKYLEHAQDLVFNENVLLQTLGFDVAIDHPHTHVVRCCHLVREMYFEDLHQKSEGELSLASKDLAQTSYFMASNSLHLTTMCLQYKPTVVACFCIHLACKWSNWEIPQSNEGKDWFWYVDKTVSLDQLELLTAEFLVIFDKCPTKLKRKIMSISATQNPTLPPPATGSLFDMEPRKIRPPDGSQQMDCAALFHTGALSSRPPPPPPPPPAPPHHMQGDVAAKQPVDKLPPVPPGPQPRDYREYKDKKERERMAQQAAVPRDGHVNKSMPSSSSKHGQAPPGMMNKPHHRDHKHQPPMRGRDQTYPKREHIFAPPVRHSEPQSIPDHHDTNHIGSGLNCNVNVRKDNQPHEMTMESSSKRSQQPGYESSSRHNRMSTSVNNSDGRVKEEVSSKMVPDVGHNMYNHKHVIDHNRHRRMGVNEPYPPRPPLPSEGVSERKTNIADVPDRVDHKPSVPEHVDRKHVITDIPDRKSHPAFNEHRRPTQPHHQAPTKSEVKFDTSSVKKEDILGNSSLRGAPPTIATPSIPLPQQQPPLPPPPPPTQALPVPVHHSHERHKSLRNKSPLQSSHSRSPAVPSRTKSPIPSRTKSPTPSRTKSPIPSRTRSPIPSRTKSPTPSRTKSPTPSRAKSPTPSRTKSPTPSRTKSPSSLRTKSPTPSRAKSPTPSRAKSPTPSRTKSPIPSRTKSPIPSNRRSNSPHGKVLKSNVTLAARSGATLEEKPVAKRPEINKQMTIKPEAEVSPVKILSGERQKSNLVTPDKAGTTVPRESPHPRSKSTRQRTPPSSVSKKVPSTPICEMPTTPVSSFGSPPLPGSASKLRATNRHRTSSSSSEPELVPVVKKLDEIRGYENIIRDSKIGIKLPNRVPDIIPPIRDRNKKEEPASSSRSNNNVSSIVKELKLPDLIGPIATVRPPSLPDDLGAVAFPESYSTNGTLSRTAIPPPSIMTEEGKMMNVSTVEENAVPSASNVDHHHKSEKKKKKKEHKHKDKEKSREERKHRHKHKEKDRHKTEAAPIKITIPKDKIVNSILEPANNPGLKLKIMKDRLKDSDSTGSSPQSAPSGGLKIKISKDIISNFNSTSAMPTDVPSSSRKRDRSSPPSGPPSKSARFNAATSEQRRSGNSSNNYGKQNGVEHHRRGGGASHYSGNKVVQKMGESDNAS